MRERFPILDQSIPIIEGFDFGRAAPVLLVLSLHLGHFLLELLDRFLVDFSLPLIRLLILNLPVQVADDLLDILVLYQVLVLDGVVVLSESRQRVLRVKTVVRKCIY